jgi:TM2 domain-containing membrane protein YozV
VALAARGRGLRRTGGAVVLALIAGATTSTVAAPPSALTPRLLAGDGQFLVDIIAAAIVSALLGWIVATVFAVRPAAAQT